MLQCRAATWGQTWIQVTHLHAYLYDPCSSSAPPALPQDLAAVPAQPLLHSWGPVPRGDWALFFRQHRAGLPTSVHPTYGRPPYKRHSEHSPALCFLQTPNTALMQTTTFALERTLSYLQHTPWGRTLQRREMFRTSQGTHRWKRLGGGNPTGERGAHPPPSPPGFGGRSLTRGAVGCWPLPRRHCPPPPPPPRCRAG